MVKSARSVARRRGHTAGVVAFALFIGLPTIEWGRQIITQAWAAPPIGEAPESCQDGLGALLDAVQHARQLAAADTRGERASLSAYRAALRPVWQARGAVGAICRGDPRAQRLLTELDLLRYAEERSVRQEAVDVARRRRRVQAMAAELGLLDPLALAKPSRRD